MNKIGYVCKWGDSRQTTWSGTPYGIYKGLQKHCEVIDRPITFSTTQNVKDLLKKVIRRLGGPWDFSIYQIKTSQKILESYEISEEEKALILFAELNGKYAKKSYVFQDITVNYLVHLQKENKNLVQFTPLAGQASEKVINKRLQMVNAFYKDCKGLFTMSKWLCEFMKQSGDIAPEKVHYVGGGCNIDASKIDSSKKTGNKFLFVGKKFLNKNGPLVVEAFKKLRKKYPEIELYVAGPTNESGIFGEGINFLGRLSYTELIKYYNECDYFVMPSRFEAYGIVFGEALIYGLPCIGKNICAMPEFIKEGENGYLIENDDADELSQKMEQMLLNKEMVERVKANRQNYIEQYSWDSVATRMYQVIEKDLQNK